MKTKRNWLVAVPVVVALVQLSCSMPLLPGESGYERLQAECELAGGTWRVEMVDGDLERWCEYPPASNPTPTGQGGAGANTLATETSSASCDASGVVSVQATLQNDGPGALGTRDCDYTLTITNNSDRELVVALYYVLHDPVHADDPAMSVSHWGYTLLGSGDTRDMHGRYYEFPATNSAYAGDYQTWYMDQISVTYASCHEQWLTEEPAFAEIEPYIRPAPYYCSP